MKQRLSRNDPAEQERRRQRRNLIFSLIVIFLFVGGGVAGYYLGGTGSNNQNQLVYGKYEFTYKTLASGGVVLTTKMNNNDIEFQSLPSQDGDISVDPAAIALLKNAQQVALVSDQNMTLDDASLVDYARLQIALAIPNAFNGMTTNDTRYRLPVINCSMASPQMPVVLFNITNDTRVVTQGDCIVLDAEQQELLRVKDRILFEYYGILGNGQVNAT